jgi:TolA-binding protein
MAKYGEAISAFNKIIKEHPASDYARLSFYETGWCYYQWGREREALSQFDDYLAKYPNSEISDDVRVWEGQYYYNKGQFPKAKTYFDALAAKPQTGGTPAEAEYWLALILYKTGDVDGATKGLEHIIEAYPASKVAVDSTMKIGDILAESGHPDDAVRELKGITEKYPGTQFEKVADKKIGDIFKQKKLYNAAIEKYRLAITEAQSDFNAETQFLIGECYEEAGDADQAMAEFLKVKYLYPEITRWSGRAGLRTATLFENKGRWKDARKIYEELSGTKLEEAKYARERLEWIKDNVPEKPGEVN